MKLFFFANVIVAAMTALVVDASEKQHQQHPNLKRSLSKHHGGDSNHVVTTTKTVQNGSGGKSKHAVSASKAVHHGTAPQKTSSHTPETDLAGNTVYCDSADYDLYSLYVYWVGTNTDENPF